MTYLKKAYIKLSYVFSQKIQYFYKKKNQYIFKKKNSLSNMY